MPVRAKPGSSYQRLENETNETVEGAVSNGEMR